MDRGSMTLNDNPRVTAERRLRISRERLDIINANYRKWIIERDATGPARLVWTGITDEQRRKAQRLCRILHKRIREDEKFVNSFR